MDNLFKLFDNKAALYAANRPGYTEHILKHLQQDLTFLPTAIGADIGSGTGQLTKILAEYFDFVYAIEPNNFMINESQKYLCNYKNIQYINCCAENTELNDSTLDYITVAQAFHLFNKLKTLQEFKRILKPNGRLVIIYNMKNHSSDLFLKNEEIIKKYCPLYKRDFHATEFKKDSFADCFTDNSYCYNYFQYDNTEYLNCDTFINRTLSASYAIQPGDKYFNNFVNELAKVFSLFSENGKIKMEISTVIYSGQLR